MNYGKVRNIGIIIPEYSVNFSFPNTNRALFFAQFHTNRILACYVIIQKNFKNVNGCLHTLTNPIRGLKAIAKIGLLVAFILFYFLETENRKNIFTKQKNLKFN